MADDRGTVHQIAWQDVFPATILLSTLRLAVNFRALLFGTLGFLAMTGGWQVIGKGFPTERTEFIMLKRGFSEASPWQTTRPLKVVTFDARSAAVVLAPQTPVTPFV